jgi:hypothetical protein
MNQPNSKYEHVYAVVRVDDWRDAEIGLEDAVVIKKIVWTEEEAKQEVERLTSINGEKNAIYFYQLTRLAKLPVSALK